MLLVLCSNRLICMECFVLSKFLKWNKLFGKLTVSKLTVWFVMQTLWRVLKKWLWY